MQRQGAQSQSANRESASGEKASGESASGDGRDGLVPVGRETVQDRIYRQLRGALIQGAFDAGEGFVVADLAQRMKVSSMPVREALARLVSERALEAGANRRVGVPMLTPERGRDLADARVLIEGRLAILAMPRLTGSDLRTLRDLTAAYEAAGDARDHARLNHAFHFHIYDRAGAPVLLPIVESLWMQAGPYIRASAVLHAPETGPAATFHHRCLIEGLQARDAAAIAAALCADIERTCRILERGPAAVWQTGAAA